MKLISLSVVLHRVKGSQQRAKDAEAQRRIRKAVYNTRVGRSTNHGAGFDVVRKTVDRLVKQTRWQSLRHVVIMVTDGRTNRNSPKATPAVKALADLNVVVGMLWMGRGGPSGRVRKTMSALVSSFNVCRVLAVCVQCVASLTSPSTFRARS